MFGWWKRRERTGALPESKIEVETPKGGPIRYSRFRIVQGPHDGLYRVQERLGDRWCWRPDCPADTYPRNAERWIEAELAGPKVIKEFP